ncbi:MAG TPA: FliA/WhiG family RNA polymerase sigma factor [Anaerolineaceae bacterium]|nr:FliA/WhiG family RNA polymerase sigma factor [Anaerolineaceae bacterium]
MMVQHANLSELVAEYQRSHDPQCREDLVLNCIPLIHFILGRLGISREIGLDYEDLVSQGLLGIIDAVDRYDPSYGTQFSTYAAVRIRGKILDYLRSLDWLSRTARNRSKVIQKAISELWVNLGQSPSEEQIANHLGIEVEKVQVGLMDSSKLIVSLDALINEDDDEGGSIYDSLPDERQLNPSDIVDEGELKRELVKALQKLSEREQLLLSLYYYEELTFKEIGQVLNITESRVCQLHARALLTLKTIFHSDSSAMLAPMLQKKQAAGAATTAKIDQTSLKRLTYV